VPAADQPSCHGLIIRRWRVSWVWQLMGGGVQAGADRVGRPSRPGEDTIAW
jgi:hypothetical protein